MVREPGPCRPTKFLLEVETASFPAGTLSGFMAKHAEQLGNRSSNPASLRITSRPSSIICWRTAHEPGTSQAVTLGAFFLPLTIEAKARKSSILPLVHAPRKQ